MFPPPRFTPPPCPGRPWRLIWLSLGVALPLALARLGFAQEAPVVVAESSPAAVTEGDTVLLGVIVQSPTPVTYEWRRADELLPATQASLILAPFTTAMAGTYAVTARNAAGAVTRQFTVRATTPPPVDRVTLDAGESHSFTASASAAAHAWWLDGEAVGTGASYTYTPARKAVGMHWLRVVETQADNTRLTREWRIEVRLPTPVSALAYFVAPDGSDAAAGTLAAPFATLERARDAIRTLNTAQRAGGVTVYVRGGIHRRTTTFTLTALDSGTEAAPIVYAAYPGETPVFTSTRVITAAQLAPLAASETVRVAPGVDPARIWEIDLTGNARANAFPSVFNEWVIFNALRSSQNGGLLELFHRGERQLLSRYPNHAADDRATPSLLMDGVAQGIATTRITDPVTGAISYTTAPGYLNGAGTYTPDGGTPAAVGGAFHYTAEDAARVARWQTALNAGGLWLAGYWRVPWQINGVRVRLIDPVNRVIGLAPHPTNANEPLVSNGIGDKYTRPAGSRKEPWWVLNLLEEMDVPGEWAVDFNRQRLYFLMDRDGPPGDGEIELADVGTPLIQLNGASDVQVRGLTFRRHLGINIQVLGGARNLIESCTFLQAGNLAVDINGGTAHGVLHSDFAQLAAGGVMLRGGATTPALAPCDHFAVNNRFRSFSEVVRVYQAAIDAGYGGPLGTWGQTAVGMRIAHNDVRTTPHAAILWNGHQHLIEYNEVSDFTRISNDFGGIYRYGPNIDSGTVIRYNHLFASPLGEGIYNDFDHVRAPIYGNVVNLKTPPTAHRGYGFWTNTNTAAGAAVADLPTTLRLFNNIAVNSRSNYSLHSSPGGVIEHNVSYRKLASDFLWYRISTNATTQTQSIAASNATTLASGPNPAYTADPGFVDFAADDLRLRPDAAVYRDLPGFTPIPLELAGNYPSPARPDTRTWTPFVVTGGVSALGANTATFTGSLVYPQFAANARVRVHWGTVDGGENPAAWQHVAELGQPGAGPLAFTPADLQPGTRYHYRFRATNAAGEHWAERSNFTTTFTLKRVSTGGDAAADSAAQPAAHAFDADPATVWRTADGVTAAALTYRFADSTAQRVTRYSLTSAPDTPARDPRSWHLLGSYDGATWVTLDTRTDQVFTARGQTLTCNFTHAFSFTHYRLEVLANAGDPAATQLAELQLFAADVVPDSVGPVLTLPGEIVVSGTSSGATVTFEVGALDAVSGQVPAYASPASGSLFPVGATTVTVTAADDAGNVTTGSFTVRVLPPALPAPWTLRQINPFANVTAGSVLVNSPTAFQITGTGGAATGGTTGDLWTGNNDSFTYVSRPWVGDGTFTARLAAFTSTDSSAKAGIILRETTSTGSRYSAIYLMRTNGGAVWAQHKTATSGSTTNVNFFTASTTSRGIPEWIRLVRTGDVVSCFHSENGTAWTPLGASRTNVLAGAVLTVGFAVAPRTGNTTATATFDQISFLAPLEVWRLANFASSDPTGTAANDADPDGDGSPNLLEYALGTSPLSFTPSPWATALRDGLLELTFLRARADLTYEVEGSGNLTDWDPVAVNPGAVGETVTVVDPVPLGPDAPRRFLRLRIGTP